MLHIINNQRLADKVLYTWHQI